MNLNSGCRCLDRRDHGRPVVVRRPEARASPQVRSKIVVQQEHRHVAADAVALPGDLRERLDHRLPKARLEGVELEHVGPCREVRIAAAGENRAATSTNDSGSFLASLRRSADEVSGCCPTQGWSGAT